jgi:hypothetical protein
VTGDLKTDLQLSLAFETARHTLLRSKSIRDLVDAWWVLCAQYEGDARSELMAIYSAKLREFGVSAAA